MDLPGTELFTLKGAVERDPAIDAWMAQHRGELGAIAQRWFNFMRTCGDEAQRARMRATSEDRNSPVLPVAGSIPRPSCASSSEVLEILHDGCPVACLGDVPFGYVNVFTAHVNVGFFRGFALPDPARLLQGTGKFMRHVKLKPGVATSAAALGRLIDAAYSDIKACVEHAGSQKRLKSAKGADARHQRT